MPVTTQHFEIHESFSIYLSIWVLLICVTIVLFEVILKPFVRIVSDHIDVEYVLGSLNVGKADDRLEFFVLVIGFLS